MASRVNLKFVIILSAVILAVFAGMASMAYYVLTKSGTEYEALGDEQIVLGEQYLERGDRDGAEQAFRLARKHYGSAVGHDQRNVAWLEKLLDATSRVTPTTQTEYRNMYFQTYLGVLQQLKLTDPASVESQRRFLTERYDLAKAGGLQRGDVEALVTETEGALRYFQNRPDDDPSATLNRYVGLGLQYLIGSGADVGTEEIEKAQDSLEKALAADPTDSECAVALARLHATLADRAERNDRLDERDEHLSRARQVLDDFIASGHADATVMISRLELDINDARRRASEGRFGAEATRAIRAEVSALSPRLDEIARSDARPKNQRELSQFQFMEGLIEPDSGYQRSVALADEMLEGDPNNAELLLVRSTIARMTNQTEASIEYCNDLLEVPMLPVSLEGLMLWEYRIEAAFRRVNSALIAWAERADPEGKDELWERVVTYRDDLANRIPEDDPRLVLVDAKIAFGEERLAEAQRLASEFNDQTGNTNPEGLWIHAQAASALNQLGTAQTQLQRILDDAPSNINARLMLASVFARLDNFDAAIIEAENVLELDPGNVRAEQDLRKYQIGGGLITSDDPIVDALIRAREAGLGSTLEPGDPRRSVEILEQAIGEFGADERLVRELVNIKMNLNDEEGARQVLASAIEQNPDAEGLRTIQALIEAEDQTVQLETMIDESESTELQKALAKFQVYAEKGRYDEARPFLEEAQRLDPTNATVVEQGFLFALGTDDYEEAERIVRVATEQNTDKLGGRTYKARLELATGEVRESVQTLRQALEQDASNPAMWRLLATAQMRLGQPNNAVESYKRAIDIRPNDVNTLNQYIGTLRTLGRDQEALGVARANERFGIANPRFMETWMNLEATVGDKEFARERRELIRELRPDDKTNNYQLALLYISLGMWDESRSLIDEARASEGAGLGEVLLDARWYAEQDDVDGARNAFVSYITSFEREELTAQPFIAFGSFMLDQGKNNVAITALEQAREYQSESLEADKALADALMRFNQDTQAIKLYQGVIDAGQDNDSGTYRKRLAEVMIRNQRFEDASELLDTFGEEGKNDLTVMLLLAEAELGEGNPSEARRILDSAATRFPEERRVFVRRARVYLFERRYEDALNDVNIALRLRPDDDQALRLQAAILGGMGRYDEAMQSLRNAVRNNPQMDGLRLELMRELISRERPGEAMEVANEAITDRPNDTDLINECAIVFIDFDMWERAGRLYKAGYDQTKQIDMANKFLEMALRQKPQDLQGAERVLLSLGSRVQEEPFLLLAQSAVLAGRDRKRDAQGAAIDALELIAEDPSKIVSWYGGTRSIFEEREDMLALLSRVEKETRYAPWARFFAGQVLLEDPERWENGLTLVEEITGHKSNELVRRLAFRRLGAAYFEKGDYETAVKAWRDGLDVFPDDWELANNIAYTIGNKLDNPSEAMPYAEMAVEAAPTSPDALDTMGVLLLKLERYDEADETFDKAATRAKADVTGAMLAVHMAQLRIKQGRLDEAQRALIWAERVMQAFPNVPPAYLKELTDTKEQLENAQ